MAGKPPLLACRSVSRRSAAASVVETPATMCSVWPKRRHTLPGRCSAPMRGARTANYLVLRVPPHSATEIAERLATSSTGGESSIPHSCSMRCTPPRTWHVIADAAVSASHVLTARACCIGDRHCTIPPPQEMSEPLWLRVDSPPNPASGHAIRSVFATTQRVAEPLVRGPQEVPHHLVYSTKTQAWVFGGCGRQHARDIRDVRA